MGREALPLRLVVIPWFGQKWVKAERVDGGQLSASPVRVGGEGCQGLEGERSESSSAGAGRQGRGREAAWLRGSSPAWPPPQRGFGGAAAKCALSQREMRGENFFSEAVLWIFS